MLVDLKTIKKVYINLEKQTIKKRQTEKLLNNLGFMNVERFSAIEDRSFVGAGCMLSHKEVLQKYKSEYPLMILEDDNNVCEWYSEFIPSSIIEIPDDTDLFYLGYSLSPGQYGDNPFVCSFFNDRIIKVNGSLSTHAIIYVTEKSKNKAIEIISSCYPRQIPFDVGYYEELFNLNVYSFNSTIFYQRGFNCKYTNVKLNNLNEYRFDSYHEMNKNQIEYSYKIIEKNKPSINLEWYPEYKKLCETQKSYKNIWTNTTNKNYQNITIYIDRFDCPENGILFLVEPIAISSSLYEYVKNNHNKYSYIISYDYEYFKNLPNFIHVSAPLESWILGSDRQIYNKTKDISFIASTKIYCKGHEFRQEMVNKFSTTVDVYGKGRQTEITNKIDGLKDYRFSIAMENCVVDGYYTEKILDCFLTGTIPIYWGSRKITDIFDSNGIVFLDDILQEKISLEELNENFYNDRINIIENNFKIADKLNNSIGNSIDDFLSKNDSSYNFLYS